MGSRDKRPASLVRRSEPVLRHVIDSQRVEPTAASLAHEKKAQRHGALHQPVRGALVFYTVYLYPSMCLNAEETLDTVGEQRMRTKLSDDRLVTKRRKRSDYQRMHLFDLASDKAHAGKIAAACSLTPKTVWKSDVCSNSVDSMPYEHTDQPREGAHSSGQRDRFAPVLLRRH